VGRARSLPATAKDFIRLTLPVFTPVVWLAALQADIG